MKVAMFGAGYVGLVSGACFSEFGVDVTCVDVDADRVALLNQGKIPIFEPGLDRLVENNMRAGRLRFTTEAQSAVSEADAVFIAVGTPQRRGEDEADLKYVFDAARTIAEHLHPTRFTVVVNKSTVPVGTGEEVAKIIKEIRPDANFAVASNPEFLREGSAIGDFMRPDRVVIGSDSQQAVEILKELYRPLYLIETPVVITNLPTAELTKYASNAFLATKITFINEIANLSEKVGADVHAVAKGMGLDGRIGKKFLHAGPGYGGSCFPKDTSALSATAKKHGSPMTIVDAVILANLHQKKKMVNKVVDALAGDVANKVIAVLGLTFKPNTDDMRDSPALIILPELVKQGARIQAYDPEGLKEAAKYLDQGVTLARDAYEACQGADGLVILTEWNQFRNLDMKRIKTLLKPGKDGRFVFCDLRNIYDPHAMRDAGFHYVCVGR